MPRVFSRSARRKPVSESTSEESKVPDQHNLESDNKESESQTSVGLTNSDCDNNARTAKQQEAKCVLQNTQESSKQAVGDEELAVKEISCSDITKYVKETFIIEGKKKIKVYKCLKCAKTFRQSYAIKRHIPIHTGERKYVCPECGRGFCQASTLSRHKATHSEERNYACPVCRATFRRVSTRDSHLQLHTSNKNFICPQCNQAFHQKGNLKTHMFTHTGEKPFKCKECDRGFAQKSNLDSHVSVVHKQKLTCSTCKESFPRRKLLEKHKKEKHSEETSVGGKRDRDIDCDDSDDDANVMESKISRIEKLLTGNSKECLDNKRSSEPESSVMGDKCAKKDLPKARKKVSRYDDKIQQILADNRKILPTTSQNEKLEAELPMEKSDTPPKLYSLQEPENSSKKTYVLVNQPNGIKIIVPVDQVNTLASYVPLIGPFKLANLPLQQRGVAAERRNEVTAGRDEVTAGRDDVAAGRIGECETASSIPLEVLQHTEPSLPQADLSIPTAVSNQTDMLTGIPMETLLNRELSKSSSARISTDQLPINILAHRSEESNDSVDAASLLQFLSSTSQFVSSHTNVETAPAKHFPISDSQHNFQDLIQFTDSVSSVGQKTNFQSPSRNYPFDTNTKTLLPATVEKLNSQISCPPKQKPLSAILQKPLSAILPQPSRIEVSSESMFSNFSFNGSDSNSSMFIDNVFH